MNGGVWQDPPDPLHPILLYPPPFFLNIHTEDTDMYAVVIKRLHGYGNEHVEEKKKEWNNKKCYWQYLSKQTNSKNEYYVDNQSRLF